MVDQKATRRDFLAVTGALALAACNNRTAPTASSAEAGPADLTLRIGPVLADIAKDHTISTTGYNGQVPAPPIHMREGVPLTVDLFNDTDVPEFVHWHGLIAPA